MKNNASKCKGNRRKKQTKGKKQNRQILLCIMSKKQVSFSTCTGDGRLQKNHPFLSQKKIEQIESAPAVLRVLDERGGVKENLPVRLVYVGSNCFNAEYIQHSPQFHNFV